MFGNGRPPGVRASIWAHPCLRLALPDSYRASRATPAHTVARPVDGPTQSCQPGPNGRRVALQRTAGTGLNGRPQREAADSEPIDPGAGPDLEEGGIEFTRNPGARAARLALAYRSAVTPGTLGSCGNDSEVEQSMRP